MKFATVTPKKCAPVNFSHKSLHAINQQTGEGTKITVQRLKTRQSIDNKRYVTNRGWGNRHPQACK